jgi:hypothetical protein
MRRIDILTPGRQQIAARMAVMAALPEDGRPVGYAPLALAAIACEDAGPIVEQLIEGGLITCSCVDGCMAYARTMH